MIQSLIIDCIIAGFTIAAIELWLWQRNLPMDADLDERANNLHDFIESHFWRDLAAGVIIVCALEMLHHFAAMG